MQGHSAIAKLAARMMIRDWTAQIRELEYPLQLRAGDSVYGEIVLEVTGRTAYMHPRLNNRALPLSHDDKSVKPIRAKTPLADSQEPL
ncbi:hypothetical protein Desti_0129 [Desulfomonile tiedjei DSM 6799]|uniref:Uncharacterized protein n=1 Tax=Desulfomonile tiedjei (strain ATCC 49306 / DSM 6799 / DCB-1) TaxID=706587 RepID=I4BZY6_DESTA|nr:hypothetical protein Desti_0129 [Desulfomonile tiedjei DSM 6799]